MTAATDWDLYYRHVPKYTSFARTLSQRKLIRLLQTLSPGSRLTICELGGANSCFVQEICRSLPVQHYHVVDLNALGLKLLNGKNVPCALTSELADVTNAAPDGQPFDIVFSVGLIEHFDQAGTARAIRAHFDRCRAGGVVLITFPTPTALYRILRAAAETAGIWKFPDERPLHFDEVLRVCSGRGALVHRSVNWLIGLTQGYVAFRKASGPSKKR